MIKTLLIFLFFGQAGLAPIDSLKIATPAEILSKAAELESNGEYEKAVELYLSISKNDTSYFQVQAELMSAYNSLKQYDNTIAIGLKIKEEYSSYRNNIYINLGNAYLDGGDVEKGMETYQDGLKLFPYNHVLLYNLGLAFNRIGNYSEAIKCFQKSAKINPYYASNHIMLGYISMLQGHRTKAALSYLTYMAINPARNGTLVFIENLLSDGLRNEGTIESITDNSLFAHYDDLIRSKAALDPRFKREVEFNANLVKQSELLLSKLSYVENTNDFWMDYYVPLYTTLQSNELQTAFIYYILQSTKNEEILQWLEKHDKEKSDWIEMANKYLSQNRLVHDTEILGKKGMFNFWYFSNNALSAVGNQLNEETRTGPWAFFYENSHLNATGNYNDQGKKVGTWKYFHENGRLSRQENYKSTGELINPTTYYYENGAVSNVANYKGDQLNGALEYYYGCGILKESMPYKEGIKHGKGIVFFNTGERELDYTMDNGEFDDDYTQYFKTGQIEKKYNYSSGLINGAYYSYYINGQLNETGLYQNDTIVGDWIGYHSNGNLSYKGTLYNGKRSGTWETYYTNGVLSEATPYNNDEDIDGEYKSFNEQGELDYIANYQEGKIMGYQVIGKNSEVLHEVSDASGNMEYKNFHPNGRIKIAGTLKNGQLNGPYISYHDNGKIFQNSVMLDGYYHGDFKEYFDTGQLYIESSYDQGSKNGRYIQYYQNGSIHMEGWYVNDQPEQLWKIYHPDGSLDEELYHVTGKTNGWSNYYAPGNKLDYSLKTEMDVLVGIKEYDSTGSIYHEAEIPYGTGIFSQKSISGDTVFKAEMQCGEIFSDIKRYHTNGKLRSSDPVNITKGGDYVSYNNEGKIRSKGSYKDGQMNGLWMFYHSNGKISTERFYEGGLIEKELKRYYYNGQLESVCAYYEDEPHGTCKYYDHAGNHQLTKIYDKDYGHIAYVDPQSGDTTVFDNRDDFTVNAYFANGKLAVTQNYKYVKYDGKVAFYNNSGNIIESVNYKFGKLQGKLVTYYATGQVYTDTMYKDGDKEGIEMEYYESGKVRRITPFVNDKIHGTEIIYKPDGSLKSETYYWNDRVY